MNFERFSAVVVLSACLLAPKLLADQVGNGGGIVQCDIAGSPSTYRTLDIYEGFQRNQIPNLGSATLTFDQKVDLALARLQTYDAGRSHRYRDRITFFLANAAFRNNIHLDRIPDSDPIVLDDGCTILQGVVRRPVIEPTDPLFIVDNRLWNKLDLNNKVALALHEVIYEEAVVDAGQTTSARTRYFNSLILSGKITQYASKKVYIGFLDTTMGFSTYEQDGVLTAVKDIAFYPQGQIKSVEIHGTSTDSPFVFDSDSSIPQLIFTKAYFHPNGNLACIPSVLLRDEVYVDRGNEIHRHNEPLTLLSFYPDRHIHFVSMSQYSRFKKRSGQFFEADHSANGEGVLIDGEGYFLRSIDNVRGGPFPPLDSPCGE